MSSKVFNPEFCKPFECVPVEKPGPILFSGSSFFWVIESGYIDIFLVPIDNKNKVCGKGLKCFRYSVGDLVFGCETFKINEQENLALFGIPSAQIKVQKGSTHLFLSGNFDLTIVEKIDSWIESIDQCLNHYFSVPSKCYLIEAEPNIKYKKGTFLSTHYRDVVWLEAGQSSLWYGGKKELSLSDPYPITHWSSLQLGADSEVSGYHTPTLLLREGFESIFKNYTQFFMKVMGVNYQSEVDSIRHSQKMYLKSDNYQEARFQNLLDYSTQKNEEPVRTEGLIQLCERIFNDWELQLPPTSELRVLENEKLEETLHRLGFGVRELNLKDWDYRKINTGYIICRKKDKVVGFFPPLGRKRRVYTYNDPWENRERDLTKKDIEESSFTGLMVYPPLPGEVHNFKDLFKYSLKGQKKQVGNIVTITFFNAILFVISPILTSKVLVRFLPHEEWGLFALALMSLFVISLITLLLYWLSGRIFLSISDQFLVYSTSFLWKRVLDLPMSFFQNNTVGKILVCLYSPISLGTFLNASLVQGFAALISGSVSLLLLLYYVPLLAVSLIFFVGVLFGLNYFLLMRLARLQEKLNELQFKIISFSLQMFNAIGKIRVAQRENFALARWADVFSQKVLIRNKSDKVKELYRTLNEHFLFYANIVFLVFVMWNLSRGLQGESYLVEHYLIVNAVLVQFVFAVVQFSHISVLAFQALPSIDRINLILKEKTKIQKGKVHPKILRGQIRFSNVFFNYVDPKGNIRPTLKDVSFSIAPGEYIAIVGASGSGKSTLVKLLLGIESPNSGAIYLDDYDLSTLDIEDVRRQMGTVLQSNEIIQGSIIKNILLDLEEKDQDLNFKRAWEAATQASLNEDINDLPMKMNTWVGRGDGLSGGQRQRLLIARAMVKQPRIILFDEATSAMDNLTQSNIKKMLDSINITRIVIAHRLKYHYECQPHYRFQGRSDCGTG